MIEGARSHPGPYREPHAQTDLIHISESSITISHRPAQTGGYACVWRQRFRDARLGHAGWGPGSFSSSDRQGLDGVFEVGQVLIDRGLQDGVCGVEVAVGEVVAHAGDLPSRDHGRGGIGAGQGVGMKCRSAPATSASSTGGPS